MHIAILGAGPSGMMAAHAVVQLGHSVTIYDKEADQARRNSGVFYLHDRCDLPLEQLKIQQDVIGKYQSNEQIARRYGLKVYGKPVEKVSVLQALNKSEIIAYNASKAIDILWDLYGERIKKYEIKNIADVFDVLHEFDRVVSTIPAYILFPTKEYRNIQYDCVQTWIKIGKAPENENWILYNVNEYFDWYRCSAIAGVFVVEFGVNVEKKQEEGYITKDVTKVIGTARFPEVTNLFVVGRYGAWDKTCLTHDVYYRTLGWLKKC